MMRRKRAARQGWEHDEPAGHPSVPSIPALGVSRRLPHPCLHMVGAQKKHGRDCV